MDQGGWQILDEQALPEARGCGRCYRLQSPYQSEPTMLKLLWPNATARCDRLPLIHLLPVEPEGSKTFGDAMEVAVAEAWADLHDIAVACCTTSLYPWMVDDPRDPTNAQGSYLSKVVLPMAEAVLTEATGITQIDHLLLGFSKSGFAALSLLFRYPQRYIAAAAWDAPLIVDRIEKSWQMDQVFSDEEHLHTHRPPALLRQAKATIKARPRVYVAGYDLFRQHVDRFTAMLDKAGVPYLGNNDTKHPHRWDQGWMNPAVEALLQMWQQASKTEASHECGDKT